jgi:hypothetical protein
MPCRRQRGAAESLELVNPYIECQCPVLQDGAPFILNWATMRRANRISALANKPAGRDGPGSKHTGIFEATVKRA